MPLTRTATIVLFLAIVLALTIGIPHIAPAAEIIGRDGTFVAYDDGTVVDTATGLMWAAKDNGEDINWSGAFLYCEEYTGGGYTDWRLPTVKELASLYRQDRPNEQGLFIPSVFTLTDVMLWSSEQKMCRAWCFDFSSGQASKVKGSRPGIARALPVRRVHSAPGGEE